MITEETKISAGSYELNKWLFGGYEKDIITMIAGNPGSGKTNFVLMASCSCAKRGKKVIFVDTEGGFSIDRVKQIVGEDYEKILENIFIFNPTNFEEQKKVFVSLLEKIKKEHVNLIVVDGMAMLYRLEIGDAIKSDDGEKIREVNREVAKQMRTLNEIARKQEIPVIITNQVYTEFLSEEEWKSGVERTTNIVGGDLFKYWSKCIIELKNNSGKRRAILLKHRSLPQKEFEFEIKNKGIFKKGWM
jgi:DNA repair protein RadB